MKTILLFVFIACALSATIRYEAEEAHVIGSGNTLTTTGYSGSGYVRLQSNPSEGEEGIIIFSVNIPQDDDYALSISYTNDVDAAVSIKINGIEQVISTLPAYGCLSRKTEVLRFRQGINSIIMKGVKMPSELGVDYVEIDGAEPINVRGATLTYYELEAENATHNGQVIGPSRELYQLPTEASQRVAVTINQGQWVEFTLTAPANAMVVRYSIPNTADGNGQDAPLNVQINGAQTLTLTVTSKYSWAYGDYPFTRIPSQGKAHHFYDEVRTAFNRTLSAGTRVRLVAASGLPYTIDLADFYTAPAPYPMPANFISVTDHGADPSGSKDSTGAFTATINAAAQQNKGVWIPQGTFLVNQRFTLNKITVRGAGPWHSTVKATVIHGVGFFGNFGTPSVDVQLYDFAIIGDTNVRVDDAIDSGVGGAFNGNSIAQNLWIEHTKCGMWLDGPFNGLHIVGCTIRNTWADGINLHRGISNVVIQQTILRNVGDDALAIWSENNADNANTFQFNTIQVPVLANGIAFYGGSDNKATDNYVADTICDGAGLQIGNRYNSVPIGGQTTMARNTLVRCGAPSRFGPQDCGSIWLWQEQGAFNGNILLQNIDSIDSNFAAVTFWSGNYNDVTISYMNVKGGPYVMEVNSASGTVPCDHVVATGLTLPYGGVHSCASLVFKDNGGNSGWDMNHDHQHCN